MWPRIQAQKLPGQAFEVGVRQRIGSVRLYDLQVRSQTEEQFHPPREERPSDQEGTAAIIFLTSL